MPNDGGQNLDEIYDHLTEIDEQMTIVLPQAVAESSNENMRVAAIIRFMDTFSAIIMVV